MTVEAYKGPELGERNLPRTIQTTVDVLLPGISGRSSISSAELEIGAIPEKTGTYYYLRFEKLHDKEDVRLLIGALSDKNPPVKQDPTKPREIKRTDFYQVDADSEEFASEFAKLIEVKPDFLKATASDLFTLDRARKDFLTNPSNGREYKKLYESKAADGSVSDFMGDVASLMKKHPELFRGRKGDMKRVADSTAISRYAQISANSRAIVHSEYLDSHKPAQQDNIIGQHMAQIYGAQPLVREGEISAFLNSMSEIALRPDGRWVFIESGNPIVITQEEGKFVVESPRSNILIGEIGWTRNGTRKLEKRATEEREIKISFGKSDDIELIYNLSQDNSSSLLGIMLLDYVANVRNRLPGKYGDSSKIPEDSFARRNAILNSELIRNAEALLAS